MPEIMAKLRWYPLGPSAGPFEPIRQADLDSIAKRHNVNIAMEEIVGKNYREVDGVVREETMNCTIDEITQTIVTVSAEDEQAFREVVRELIKKYGAPRTTYATWGSTERGKWIVGELSDEYDGWS